MKKKHQNMIRLLLNAMTLTLFTLLQMVIYIIVNESFHGGMLITIYIVSLCFVPLLWWGMFPRVK